MPWPFYFQPEKSRRAKRTRNRLDVESFVGDFLNWSTVANFHHWKNLGQPKRCIGVALAQASLMLYHSLKIDCKWMECCSKCLALKPSKALVCTGSASSAEGHSFKKSFFQSQHLQDKSCLRSAQDFHYGGQSGTVTQSVRMICSQLFFHPWTSNSNQWRMKFPCLLYAHGPMVEVGVHIASRDSTLSTAHVEARLPHKMCDSSTLRPPWDWQSGLVPP